MAIWLRVLEAWAVTRLLQSPSFHRAVHNAHKTFHRVRHGTPMEELGGTNVDAPKESFLKHFKDEIAAQFSGKATKPPSQPGAPPPTESHYEALARRKQSDGPS